MCALWLLTDGCRQAMLHSGPRETRALLACTRNVHCNWHTTQLKLQPHLKHTFPEIMVDTEKPEYVNTYMIARKLLT